MISAENLKLADIIVNFSCKLQKGEKILIESTYECKDLIRAIIQKTYEVGGLPFVRLSDENIDRELLLGCSEEQMALESNHQANVMNNMDAYVAMRFKGNSYETSDVPQDNMNLYTKYIAGRVHKDIRVGNTKWVVLRYPSPSTAQKAEMSLDAFEKFYYDVCTLDYDKMSKAMDSLVTLMEKTDNVRLVAKDTDISFSIQEIPAIKCDGEKNLPDGEVFTAPVKNSINGVISYNTPSEYQGFKFENIRLEFKDGKIINATANNTEKINKIFDTDEGARYVGEFAIGVNPYVTKPMCEILFDEKIAGSIHLTPGCCYDEAPNGNKSDIHWDLVLIQTPEYGGGEIYFDDVLIRKDGLFVLPELEGLNPENLK
ncbi:MAG: aminopeptidase [Clostridiales bacterium GWE2_32_10]|nr:MAG: aminopeptidase [Clostridiales bacterium GWE2_32_10]HBY21055.1 aminopeptidase [Clostridiales bacterium]